MALLDKLAPLAVNALSPVWISAFLLSCSCTGKNPDFCAADEDCTAALRPVCDVEGAFGDRNTCVEDSAVDAGVPQADAFAPDGPSPDACAPATCESLGALCGPYDDGCGGQLSCGLCLAAANGSTSVQVSRYASGNLEDVFTGLVGRSASDLVWNDVDRDGDLDLVVANSSDPNVVLRNDGAEFSIGWEAVEDDQTVAIALGDIDDDGDDDLAVANSNQPDRVYRNDGGTFVPVWSSPLSASSKDIALADFNGDGFADLVIAERRGPTRVFTGDGTGEFSFTWASETLSGSDLVAADFDGDGDVDIAVGGCEVAPGEPTHVYLNVGTGFDLTWSSSQTACVSGIAWATTGSLARLVVAYESERVEFFSHSADGVFIASEFGPGGPPTTNNTAIFGFAVTDLGTDGDFDYALAVEDGPNEIYVRSPSGFELDWIDPGDGLNTTAVAWSE